MWRMVTVGGGDGGRREEEDEAEVEATGAEEGEGPEMRNLQDLNVRGREGGGGRKRTYMQDPGQ